VKILLITQEPPLAEHEVVSGNAVRSTQLTQALLGGGHTVEQIWLNRSRRKHAGAFRNHDELQGLLALRAPDVIVVSYWELLGLLPFDLEPAVILDFVAPRPLEELFESPELVRRNLRRLRTGLERCDLLLVGNELQKHLLVNTLLQAGFDLRHGSPVIVVPLGAEPVGQPHSEPAKDGWMLAAGGVSWPWRSAGSYTRVLEEMARAQEPPVRIAHFGGQYRWHEQGDGPTGAAARPQAEVVEFHELQPYRTFSEFLTRNAHIGVELAEWNIERQYSQSFRSLEFLRHGLPLLCNRYLPISALIEEFDAGWVVDSPESLRAMLPAVFNRPDDWKIKSANALKLVNERLRPQQSSQALLQWLESPSKARRLPGDPPGLEVEPVLGVPPLKERISRQIRLVNQVLLGRLFGGSHGSGVLFITRGDLFPPDHGAAVRTVETARALSRKGLKVGIVTDDRARWYEIVGGETVTRKYPWWLRLLSTPGSLVKLLHYTKDLPFSNSFLYLPLTDKGFKWRALAAAKRIEPAILQAEFPAYVKPCIGIRDALECKVVLVEHNVEYERIRNQVEELTPDQYQQLKTIEISMCNAADRVVCVSDNDRQKLAEDGVDTRKLTTIAHGVDLSQYEAPPVDDVRGRFEIHDDAPLLVFHGTFSYPPNREALRIFAEILLPGLEDRGLKCHVLAVGRNPPAVRPHQRIHFTGSVTEVGPWLKSADICVIPLTDGGGTRMKIIDCFAAGLPVISTSKGIEGIPVVAGRQALILDEWGPMMDAITSLWNEPARARELAACGRNMAESLDWNVIADQYASMYSTLP
jgi:glycosyltransferase involved in cell wall biosynthesis